VSGVDFASLMKKIYLIIRSNGVAISPSQILLQFQQMMRILKVPVVHLSLLVMVQNNIGAMSVEGSLNN
jgi:hypothetical protein